MPIKKQQLELDIEQQTGSKLGKEYVKAVYCHPAYLAYMQNTSSSVCKESSCNSGDPSSIPRSGRSTEEGIGYPLQHSSASFVTQLVKNEPAMPETWVRSLGLEDTLEKGKATHSSILAWRIPWTV